MSQLNVKHTRWIIILMGISILPGFRWSEDPNSLLTLQTKEVVLDLKKAAFEVLDSKCNACHRRKNPFMIFSIKNMEKRAPKIYAQVFIERRMPKGNEIKLTNEEYHTLEKWLLTQKIY